MKEESTQAEIIKQPGFSFGYKQDNVDKIIQSNDPGPGSYNYCGELLQPKKCKNQINGMGVEKRIFHKPLKEQDKLLGPGYYNLQDLDSNINLPTIGKAHRKELYSNISWTDALYDIRQDFIKKTKKFPMLHKQNQNGLFLSQSSSNIGPGSYNLSFSLLNTSKSSDKKAISFENNNNNNDEKQKRSFWLKQDKTPGAGAYNPEPLKFAKGPIFRPNYYHQSLNDNSTEIPGPSYYSISHNYTTKYKTQKKVIFERSDRGLLKIVPNCIPGPTYYFQEPITSRTTQSITFPKQRRKLNESGIITPGPCSYNITEDLSLYDKKLKFKKGVKIEQLKRFQKQKRQELKQWCQINQQIYNKAKKKEETIALDDEDIKYKKKSAKQNQSVIARLYKLKQNNINNNDKKQKPLKKPEPKMSPLEIEYQIQKKFVKGDFTKNSSRKLEFLGIKKDKEPSPDTYQIKREVADKYITLNRSGRKELFGIKSFLGNPGPGAYQLPSSFASLKSKKKEDYKQKYELNYFQ